MFNGVNMVLIKHLMILLRDGDAGQDVVQKYLQDSGDWAGSILHSATASVAPESSAEIRTYSRKTFKLNTLKH